jgi:NAD(P)-dependent dehydrogenase (short-subunit alcohol dehydrogenase family)
METVASLGEPASVCVTDVACEADVLALREAVLARHGGLDVLVNNAGVNPIFRGRADLACRLAAHHRRQPHWRFPVLQIFG